MAEEAPIIELDVNEIVAEKPETEQVEDTTAEEPSTEETKPQEAAEDEEPSDETETDEDAEPEAVEPEAEAEPEETETELPARAKARADGINEHIQGLLAQERQLQDRVSQLNAQAYQPETAEQLEANGMDPVLARLESAEQRAQLGEYNSRVAQINQSLEVQANQVMRDFEIFNPESPSFKPEIATRAKEAYLKAANIQTDPNTGLVNQVNAQPYEIYQAFAEAYQAGAQSGKVSGQKANDTMLANADTPSSSAPATPKEDPFLTGLTKKL